MKLLITGGAGYLGSEVVNTCIDCGYKVSVVDNLSRSKFFPIKNNCVTFHEVDLCNYEALVKVINSEEFDCIIHLAAYTDVEESMVNQKKYAANIKALKNLVELTKKSKSIKNFIFTSSCAVYGNCPTYIVNEQDESKPVNYYGYTKYVGEKIIINGLEDTPINFTIFRCFNLIGNGTYKLNEGSGVFGKIINLIRSGGEEFQIFGNDYDTKDGTAIRDYIDIRDVVQAIIHVIHKPGNGIFNLGNGKPVSLIDLVNEFNKVTSNKIKIQFAPRRNGDIEKIYADNGKLKNILKYFPRYTLAETIADSI